MTETGVARIMESIREACVRCGRDEDSVRLLGVSKGVSAETVKKAIAQGLGLVGENRVQEARRKAREDAYTGAGLCLVGHLQSNKASMAARVFDQVHSLDSFRIASSLSKFRLQHKGPDHPMPVLIEVNVGRDPAKHGVAPELAGELAAKVLEMPCLNLKGLMTVPPGYGDLRLAREAFGKLRELSYDLIGSGVPAGNMRELSMGMSGDYLVAIEEGATLVRIGTALFGPRQ